MWKPGHPPLQNNKNGSLSRLSNLIRKLRKQPKEFEEYKQIIQTQLSKGIIEEALKEVKGTEFYILHKAVVREESESTKMRIFCDASAKSILSSPSLHECLETGASPQNLLWNVLLRNHFSPAVLCGDIKQVFLQMHIKEQDRDAIRFHCLVDKDPNQIETYGLTRALFVLVQSLFILGGTLTVHLGGCKERYPIEVDEILRSLYKMMSFPVGITYQKLNN